MFKYVGKHVKIKLSDMQYIKKKNAIPINLKIYIKSVRKGRKEHLEIKTNIYYTTILAIGNKSVTNLYIQYFVEIHIYKMILFCLSIKIAYT